MRMFVIAAALLAWCWPAAVHAGSIQADIYRSKQVMVVKLNGRIRYRWPVSTGLKYGWTRRGRFRPFWLNRHHKSSLYNDAPMPHSVFYDGDRAIHGTYEIGKLGKRASHGCVRLHWKNARRFFNLVRRHGKRRTRIVVH